jgi:hypothetical protein
MASEIKANSIQDKTGTRVLASDSGSAWSWGSGVPSGSIVQVQHTQFGTHGGASQSSAMTSLSTNEDYVLQASTSSASTDGSATGILDVTITPKITGSKMWIQSQWFGELDNDVSHDFMFFFWRSVSSSHTKLKSSNTGGSPAKGETGIMAPTRTYPVDHVGSTSEVCFMQYFDTHGQNAGQAITYKLGFSSASGNISGLYTNRTNSDNGECGVSNLCVMELAP